MRGSFLYLGFIIGALLLQFEERQIGPWAVTHSTEPHANVLPTVNITSLDAATASHYLNTSLVEGQVLHWDLQTNPIRVYVAPNQAGETDGYPYKKAVVQALQTWENGLGEVLHFVQVESPNQANVEIYWTQAPIPSHIQEFANATCEASILENHRIIHATIHLATQNPYTHQTYTPEQIHRFALHELGHALGLSHSLSPNDMMYEEMDRTNVSTPSPRDFHTLQLIYFYAQKPNWHGPTSQALPTQKSPAMDLSSNPSAKGSRSLMANPKLKMGGDDH